MPAPHSEILLPPRCELCGSATARLGKLPAVGLRPLVYVYKCKPCNRISSVEPKPRHRDSGVVQPHGAARAEQAGSKTV